MRTSDDAREALRIVLAAIDDAFEDGGVVRTQIDEAVSDASLMDIVRGLSINS